MKKQIQKATPIRVGGTSPVTIFLSCRNTTWTERLTMLTSITMRGITMSGLRVQNVTLIMFNQDNRHSSTSIIRAGHVVVGRFHSKVLLWHLDLVSILQMSLVTQRVAVSAKAHITLSDSVQMQRNRRQYENGAHPPSGSLGAESCMEVEEDTSDMRIAESRMSFYWQKRNYTKLNFWGKL